MISYRLYKWSQSYTCISLNSFLEIALDFNLNRLIKQVMKKCLIFFTLLLVAISIAVLTEDKEVVAATNDVAMGESTKDIQMKDQALSLE